MASAEQNWNTCAWCEEPFEGTGHRGAPVDIGGGKRMHKACHRVYEDTIEKIDAGQLTGLEPTLKDAGLA